MFAHLIAHPPYAEDQPLPHTILTIHTFHRGLQTGALFGGLASLPRSYLLLRSARPASPLVPGATATTAASIVTPTSGQLLARTSLKYVSWGMLIGFGAMVVGLPMKMRGREEIEWEDRSWRLLENKGQEEVDDFSPISGALGGVFGGVRGPSSVGVLARVSGGFGIGNLVGVGGYMVWRYGVHQGKWDD